MSQEESGPVSDDPAVDADADTVVPPSAAAAGAEADGVDLPGYRCRRLIAQGGMGRVYLARQEALDREVALKLVRPELAADREIADRFLREARVLARLRHPGVVAVHDAGEAGGKLYIATEYVAGGDLAARIEREGALPEREVLRIGIAVAEALEALHGVGLVHRDVKPENLLLDESDGAEPVPKLADLGLARAATGEDRVTVTGAAMGTPAYMAPEQAEGAAEVDARVDVYALGATLFTLATGSPPFTGSTPWAVVGQLLTVPAPDLRERRPTASPALAALLADCLAKDPQRRPASAAELARRLRAVESGEADAALAASAPSTGGPGVGAGRRRLVLGLAAALGVFAFCLLIALTTDDSGTRNWSPPVQGEAAAPAPTARPVWAAASGRDGFGTWAELRVDGVAHRLRWCPPGRFTMGSPPDESGHLSGEEQREVLIERGFWLGATEVPQELWIAVMGENPSRDRDRDRDHPVEGVSWDRCQDFLAALRERTGAPAALPSEIQWEYATRAGGAEGPYGGWSDPSQLWFGRDPEAGHRAVGSTPPNRWGFHEMLGNVAEWCADPAAGARSRDGTQGRAVRGGAWFSAPPRSRAAARSIMPADFAGKHVGLRLMIPVEADEAGGE